MMVAGLIRSYVLDMMTSSEWLMIENDLSGEYEIVGSAPDVTVRQDNKYFINVCYYSPVNYGLCVSI